ncbi:MAG TPA: hypothetical protein VMW08_00400 [Acidimicrobiales bacterium]|nr:hypothetical protein [Acidimicrobiales bacterium]
MTPTATDTDEIVVGDVLGLVEIAALLEVQKRTPRMWQFRGLLPAADFESVNHQPAWKRRTVLKWAATTDRLPESGALDAEAKRYLPKPKKAKAPAKKAAAKDKK